MNIRNRVLALGVRGEIRAALEEDKMEGTVKWFNRRKGYGFIQGEDGTDYFVHHSALPKDTFLNENDHVTFEPAESEKGKQAQKVKLGK